MANKIDVRTRQKIMEYKEKFGMDAWDLHCHTKNKIFRLGKGSDGQHSVRKMMKTASKRGLDGLLIADHNSAGNFRKAAYWANHYGIKTLPTTETSTKDGHVVGIFPKCMTKKQVRKTLYRWDKEGNHYKWSANKVAQKIHELGGVAILAHPYSRRSRACGFLLRKFDSKIGMESHEIESRASELDGIEEINTSIYTPLYSVDAKKYGKAGVAVSDAHTKRSIGFGATYVPATEQPDDLLDHIRNRETEAVLIEENAPYMRIDRKRFRDPGWMMRCAMLYTAVFFKTIYNKMTERYHKSRHRTELETNRIGKSLLYANVE